MDHRFKCKIKQLSEENIGENIQDLILRHDTKITVHKRKKSYNGLHQNLELFFFKGPCQEKEKTSYTLGENTCKL